MEILNKQKLIETLEKWKGHPSITGLMEKFTHLQSYTNKHYKDIQSYTKQKIKESKYALVELPYIDVTEDPVRPELDLTFRQTYGRKILGLRDEEGDIAAIVCFAFTDEVPKTVEELEKFSYDSAIKASHRSGVQGSIAIAYTVWAKKKGGGRAIINEVYKRIKKSNHLNRLVTLSPLTKMARNFHIKNGAKELQVNEASQNFEYDITLEDWETALVKAKKFLKIS